MHALIALSTVKLSISHYLETMTVGHKWKLNGKKGENIREYLVIKALNKQENQIKTKPQYRVVKITRANEKTIRVDDTLGGLGAQQRRARSSHIKLFFILSKVHLYLDKGSGINPHIRWTNLAFYIREYIVEEND